MLQQKHPRFGFIVYKKAIVTSLKTSKEYFFTICFLTFKKQPKYYNETNMLMFRFHRRLFKNLRIFLKFLEMSISPSIKTHFSDKLDIEAYKIFKNFQIGLTFVLFLYSEDRHEVINFCRCIARNEIGKASKKFSC